MSVFVETRAVDDTLTLAFARHRIVYNGRMIIREEEASMRPARLTAAVLSAAVFSFALAPAAHAKCTKLAFSVNDYGKEGPTNDAKRLLDGYIARWAKDNGVKSYTTGKKTVSCELYLDVGIFDEHTCKAEALVCWGAPAAAGQKATEAAAGPAATAAPAAAPAKAEAPKAEPKQ